MEKKVEEVENVAKLKTIAQNQKPATKARKRVRMNDALFKNTKEETKKAGGAELASDKQTSKEFRTELNTTTTAAADTTADKTSHREKSAQKDLSEETKTGGTFTEKRVEIAPFQYPPQENKTDNETQPYLNIQTATSDLPPKPTDKQNQTEKIMIENIEEEVKLQ